MLFSLLIYVKMATNVGICWHFNINEQEKCHGAELSMIFFITSGPGLKLFKVILKCLSCNQIIRLNSLLFTH